MSEQIDAIASKFGIDRDSLRAKYQAERDKRVRSDHTDQYVAARDEDSTLVEDPFVEPGFQREALTDEVEVLIVGAGFGGMLAAVRLRALGVDDIRLIDAGGDFGGTWYWNRYPGAQCDIESYCYLPLLEEQGYMPKERYSYAPEIFDYARDIGTKNDLYERACFQTSVTKLTWDESAARWIVETDRGDRMRARFVVNAIGSLSKPRLPGIPGIESYEGHTFHTSRWDYDYTGGDHRGNLEKLSDKRIAIIGTGCTAIQCVPFLGESAEHLYVFQRTPASVSPRGNAPTDSEWAATLEPGWQEARRRNFDDVFSGRPVEEVLVQDGWTILARKTLDAMSKLDPSELTEDDYVDLAELVDFQQNEEVRSRVDEMVTDPETREKLKAWYRMFCKRPTFNDDYLPTFNRPNVTLVDTSETKGVERITKKGVVVGGREYEVDCIIFATGFELGTLYTSRAGFEIVGTGDLELSEYWGKSQRSFHGMTVHGYPNLFILQIGDHGAFGVNITAILDDQARHISQLIKTGIDRGARSMQPSAEAEAEWVAALAPDYSIQSPELAFHDSCTPSYYNNEGDVRGSRFAGTYPHGVNAFAEFLAEWRDSGMPGMTFEIDSA